MLAKTKTKTKTQTKKIEEKKLPRRDPKLDEAKKSKFMKWIWIRVESVRGQQVVNHIPDGECAAPRIKELDEKTWTCFRDGRYLGCEASENDAKLRCILGKISERNERMEEWTREHPGEIPPFLDFTAEERREWWRHHPPKAIPAELRASGGMMRVADTPEAAAIRRDLAQSSGAKRGGVAKVKAEALPAGYIVVVKPHRAKAGTGKAERWEFLYAQAGRTVEAYLQMRGSNATTLGNALKSGHVRVDAEAPTAKAVSPEEKPATKAAKKEKTVAAAPVKTAKKGKK
jgi:hypothetical protein